MARIRSIKPEFWSSEQVMDLSPMARLLFIGLWNFCDDGGNHPASAKTLKAEVFPSDDITSASVQLLVDELSSNSLIVLYSSGGKEFWHVNGWKHQKIDKPTYKHPPFIEGESNTTRRGLGEASPPESSRVESKGEEVNPLSVVAGSEALPKSDESKSAGTRKGLVCGLLRKAGMADAAPHYLTDETWAQIFAKRTDEEIVELAVAKMAARPGQRTGLKYIAPALLQDPEPINPGGPSHATRQGSVADTVASFTGRNREPAGLGQDVIEGSATRVVDPG